MKSTFCFCKCGWHHVHPIFNSDICLHSRKALNQWPGDHLICPQRQQHQKTSSYSRRTMVLQYFPTSLATHNLGYPSLLAFFKSSEIYTPTRVVQSDRIHLSLLHSCRNTRESYLRWYYLIISLCCHTVV